MQIQKTLNNRLDRKMHCGKNRPNILFLFADDLRFDTINALGNNAISTPNIDRIIKSGTAFTNAHIPGGTVPAVCMPSRAMLHTGRTLFHIEEAGKLIPAEHITMAETFRNCGYITFGSGKWHNGSNAFARGFTSGNDIFFGGMADHWNVPSCSYDPSGKYDKNIKQTISPSYSNRTKEIQCDHIHPGVHSSELIADAGMDFLENYDNDQPFFAFLSFLAPHDPRTMPEEFLRMYNPEDIKLPGNFMEKHPFENGAIDVRDEKLADLPRRPEEIRKHIAEYYAMISHLDFHIGRIMRGLSKKNLLENTIVVFAADNGLALGQHGLMGKQNCYEHSVRVPLVFSGPGITEDRRANANVYLFDIFPTLCELSGISIPPTAEGKSLNNAVNAPGGKVRNSMYFAYGETQRAVKKGGFKLIEYVINKQHKMTQLFNLKNDPDETDNLAGKPAYRSKLGEIRNELFALRDEWEDKETVWGKTFWDGYSR